MLSPRSALPGERPHPWLAAALAPLAGAALSLLLAACAAPTASTLPVKPSPGKAEQGSTHPTESSLGKAEQLASLGQFQEALDEYRSLHAKSPEDREIVASYLKTVGTIMAGVDTEYLRGNFAAAGRGYRILFDSYPDFGAFAASLSFDRTALREKMDQCANQLTTEGLQRYRRGEIKAAIALWQGILSFDPDNIEIRKAIDNANAQEENLREAK